MAIADGACVTSSREEFFISRSTAADESRLREKDVLSVNTSSQCFSACLPRDVEHANYADIEGRCERAYAPMPRGVLASQKKTKNLSL